jgi:hypothetical protein
MGAQYRAAGRLGLRGCPRSAAELRSICGIATNAPLTHLKLPGNPRFALEVSPKIGLGGPPQLIVGR